MTFEKKHGLFRTLMRGNLSDEQIKAMAHTQSFLEVQTGIQTILYQINTITIGSGLVPKVHFLVDVRDIETIEEERIVFEFIKQKSSGIKDGIGNILVTHYPKVVYMCPKDSNLRKKFDYITTELLASECEFTFMNEERYDRFLKDIKKFNQGSVAINLAKIAIDSIEDGKDFIEMLHENLTYCYEGLLCRNHNLQGIYSDKSPIHWRYGAIARLGEMERIDQFLKKGSSVMTLVVCGFESAMSVLEGSGYSKKNIREIIEDTVKTWNKDNIFETVISNDPSKFGSCDSEEYKKYGVSSLADSLSFMTSDYFKDGLLYNDCNSKIDFVSDDVINRNMIIRKNSSTFM